MAEPTEDRKEPTEEPNGDKDKGTEPRYTEAEVRKLIEQELSGNEGYKNLQRAMTRLDKNSKRELEEKQQEIQRLREEQRDLTEGMDELNKLVLETLPDEQREKLIAELQNKRIARIEKQNEELRKAREETPKPQDDDDDEKVTLEQAQRADFEKRMRQAIAEANEALEDAVATHGLDPKAKGLDYGDESQPFAARLKALNKSIKAIQEKEEEQELSEVRGEKRESSRERNGRAPSQETQNVNLLKLGAAEVLQRLQKESAASRG